MPLYNDDGADTRASRRGRSWETNPQAQPPRNLPRRDDEPHEDFHSDEHPEIPKIRRASRYLDSYPSGSHYPATRASEIETESTRRVPPSQKQKKLYEGQKQYPKPMRQVARSPRPRPQVDVLPSTPQPASTRGRALRRPPTRRYKQEALWPFLPQFAQRQSWLKISGLIIALLLVLTVMSSLLHNIFSQVPGIIIIPGSTNNGTTSTDPHALVITPLNTDHPAPPVYAQGAVLLDANAGTTIYAHNPFTHLPVMSTTKLMTALLAVEHGNLDQTVTINGPIANNINQLPPDSSNINLKAGESYTLRQLMYGLLLASGNDAAIAIADTIGGSYANFIAMMNQKAAELGLHDTHFQNPHGLQEPNHYSCAHDLAILGLNSLNNSTIHQISGTLNYHIDQTPEHAAHDFFNGNQFIWWYPGVDAGKPGYDAATNFVQVVSCVRNGHHLIGVTIHTINWWTDMRDLMNWGFNAYTWLSPHDLNTPDHPIPYANLWNNFASDTRESAIPTADHGRYYIYTGYSVTGDIENYFDKNGGLTSFGFPLSQPNAVAQNTLRQRFEHSTIQCNTQNKQCQKGI
jgi:D-alanyl-D-alanine carboxypeptidase